MLKRWWATGVFALSLVAVLWRSPSLPLADFAQALPVDRAICAEAAAALPATFSWSDLPRPTVSAHAVSVVELPDAASRAVVPSAKPVPRLLAVWFGGSSEGAADVALYQSEMSSNVWQPAREIMSRTLVQQQLKRNIRKLGNPVLVASPTGSLQLFFVSVSYGGWAGSALNRSMSDDAGQSWSPARRLISSPFFNLSTLVRNPPLWYADGSLGLPVYHEFITKHGEWLHLSATGRVLGKTRMPQSGPALQPAVVAFDARHAVAALRDAGPGPGRVQWSETHDAGQSWQAKAARDVPNPNSAVAMIGLQDGSLLMACNPLAENRNRLALFRSRDQGVSWTLVRIIEDSPDERAEFSYPALLQDSAGAVHLLYTWQRQGIRHAVFSQAWLNNPGPPNVAAVQP